MELINYVLSISRCDGNGTMSTDIEGTKISYIGSIERVTTRNESGVISAQQKHRKEVSESACTSVNSTIKINYKKKAI